MSEMGALESPPALSLKKWACAKILPWNQVRIIYASATASRINTNSIVDNTRPCREQIATWSRPFHEPSHQDDPEFRASSIWMTWPIDFSSIMGCSFILEEAVNPESAKDSVRYPAIYGAADVFVIPSRQDNLPLTALEALACGIPVIGFGSEG